MQVKYLVKESKILGAGKGIFADEFIKKGTLVWKFRKENHVYYPTEKDLLKKLDSLADFQERQNYLMYVFELHIGDRLGVAYELDDGKYVNHSFEANVGRKDNNVHDWHEFDWYALRDIQKGEEIFDNYIHYIQLDWFEELKKKYKIWTHEQIKSNL